MLYHTQSELRNLELSQDPQKLFQRWKETLMEHFNYVLNVWDNPDKDKTDTVKEMMRVKFRVVEDTKDILKTVKGPCQSTKGYRIQPFARQLIEDYPQSVKG